MLDLASFSSRKINEIKEPGLIIPLPQSQLVMSISGYIPANTKGNPEDLHCIVNLAEKTYAKKYGVSSTQAINPNEICLFLPLNSLRIEVDENSYIGEQPAAGCIYRNEDGLFILGSHLDFNSPQVKLMEGLPSLHTKACFKHWKVTHLNTETILYDSKK